MQSTSSARSIGPRHSAGATTLVRFLYKYARASQEVVDVRLPAIRLEAPTQTRLLGKGRKERLVPWPEITALLQIMLKDLSRLTLTTSCRTHG